MSEETTTEEMSEKTQADNFAELRAQKEALEAELRPLRAEKAVVSAGFDPTTPEGKALTRLALTEADVDADKVKGLAEELGFEASKPKPALSPNERAAQEFSGRLSDLNSVTTSDDPGNIATQIAALDQQIAQARAQGLPSQQLMSQRIALATRAALSAGPRV